MSSPGWLFSSVISDHPESPGPLKALGDGDLDVKAVMSRGLGYVWGQEVTAEGMRRGYRIQWWLSHRWGGLRGQAEPGLVETGDRGRRFAVDRTKLDRCGQIPSEGDKNI